jgi:hypothetical protein
MAEILEFKARPALYRSVEPIPAEGARILFFLGVRYERIEAGVETPTKPAGGGKSSNARGRRRRA